MIEEGDVNADFFYVVRSGEFQILIDGSVTGTLGALDEAEVRDGGVGWRKRLGVVGSKCFSCISVVKLYTVCKICWQALEGNPREQKAATLPFEQQSASPSNRLPGEHNYIVDSSTLLVRLWGVFSMVLKSLSDDLECRRLELAEGACHAAAMTSANRPFFGRHEAKKLHI